MVSSTGIKRKFTKLCGPAQFYVVVSLLSIAFYVMNMLDYKQRAGSAGMTGSAQGLVIHGVVIVVWTCVLNWVCSLKNGTNIAWILIFLPILLAIGLLIVMYHFVDEMDLSKQDIQDIIRQTQQEDEVEGFCDECV